MTHTFPLPPLRSPRSARRGRWLVEVKRGLAPAVSKGLLHALRDLQPQRTFVVYSGDESYPIAETIEASGLHRLAKLLGE